MHSVNYDQAGERGELNRARRRFRIKQLEWRPDDATSLVMAPWDPDPNPDLALPFRRGLTMTSDGMAIGEPLVCQWQ
jgi:hypothetical protein